MNPRILALGLILLSIASASAIGIIGATDSGPESYDHLILEEVLILARNAFGDVVELDVKSFSEVTDADLEENIVILISGGRVLMSVPDSVDAMLQAYLDQLETWIAPYLPYLEIDAEEVIESGIEEAFSFGCFKSDSGIYEAGVTSGVLRGQTVPASYEDLCVGDLLIEYACEDDFVVRLQIPCDQGCSSGACIRPVGASGNGTEPMVEGTGTGSGTPCDTRWLWTRNGFVCERPDVPVDEVEIVAPAQCIGCVSGERCMIYGDRLPDNRTCTGIGFTCLGCEVSNRCIPNRAAAPDGRLCVAGALIQSYVPPEPVVAPPPEPEREREPIEELFVPEPSKNRGLLSIIGEFFRNLFRRG
jgi:hypothetical protein